MRREDKWIPYVEPHGLARVYQRGISKEQVELALRRPGTVRKAKHGGKRFEKNFSRKSRIAVIAEETNDTLWVTTALRMK